MKLNEKQEQHYNSVMWLLDTRDYIREGRTHLMTKCFVDLAIKHLGTTVEIFDHYPLANKVCENYTPDIVRTITATEEYKDYEFKITKKHITATRAKNKQSIAVGNTLVSTKLVINYE